LEKEKKERKVIPLWVRLGGVAALIAVLFSVGNWIYSPSDLGAPSITDENIIKIEKEINENDGELDNDVNSKESQVASEENTLQNESTKDLNISEDNTKTKEKKAKPSDINKIKSSEKSNRTIIASSNSDKNDSKSKDKSRKDLIGKNSQKNDLNDGMATSQNVSEKSSKELEKALAGKIGLDVEKGRVNNEEIQTTSNGIAVNDNSEKNLVKTEKEIAEDSQNKKSIFDAIAEENEDVIAEKTKKQKPEH